MKTTRRGFMKATAFGAGAAAVAALSPIAANANEPASFGPNEVGMLYDSTLCVGCKACVYSCRKANFDLDETVELAPKDAEDTRWADVNELDYRTKNIIKMYQSDDKTQLAFMKRQCMHCNHAGCVSACPVKAMVKNPETGIVEYYKDKCIGCRYCQIACPFSIPSFEWHDKFGKIVKCELCRETNLVTKGMPACVEVCPTKAVIYGKRNELLEIAKERLNSDSQSGTTRYINKVYGEFDYGGTNVIYLSGVDFEKLGLPNLPTHSFADTSEHLQHTLYKGMIAPISLYAILTVVSLVNQHKHNKENQENHKEGGK